MISDILSIFKFITDTQTRQTIQQIAVVASRRDKDWAKSIKHMSGRFAGNDIAKVNAFANSLFSEVETIGLSQEKIHKCQTVFSELVNNAFKHGCKSKPNCFVNIDCIYSRWFVEIEVRDEGQGFNLAKVLESSAIDRQRRSGLQLVRDLADNLSTNPKGNTVTALIASADRITVETSVEKHGKTELGVITLDEQNDWHFLNASWGPLQRALNRVKQKYVLVTWKSGIKKNPWDTGRLGRFIGVVTGCQLHSERYYSFVINVDWVFQDLENLKWSANVHFSDNERDAREWLIELAHRTSKV